MIGKILKKNEIKDLRNMTDRELVALHNISAMSARMLRVGDVARSDEIWEVVKDEMKVRELF